MNDQGTFQTFQAHEADVSLNDNYFDDTPPVENRSADETGVLTTKMEVTT